MCMCSSEGANRCWIGGEYVGGTSWKGGRGPLGISISSKSCGDGGCQWEEPYPSLENGVVHGDRDEGASFRMYALVLSGKPVTATVRIIRATTYCQILCVVIGALLVGIAILAMMKRSKLKAPRTGAEAPRRQRPQHRRQRRCNNRRWRRSRPPRPRNDVG